MIGGTREITRIRNTSGCAVAKEIKLRFDARSYIAVVYSRFRYYSRAFRVSVLSSSPRLSSISIARRGQGCKDFRQFQTNRDKPRSG